MPPARKRRKIEPRTRITQHLDLMSDTAQSEYDRSEALDSLLYALRKRRKIVVIAGAGISVSAGIPDFRSSHGLFRSLRGEHKLKGSGKELFDASVYKDDSSTSSFHDMVRKLSKLSANAKPTLFHRLLACLAKENRLLRLYTQNVDGLENCLEPLKTEVPLSHKAPWPRTIQLHGGLEKMMCQKCRHISNFEPNLFDGPSPPLCPECVTHDALRTNHAGKRSHGVGKLRPRMVLYNEHNPDDEAIGAVTRADFRTRPDAVIVVGTSMKIPAVRRITHEMCNIVRDRREGTAIWINRDPVPSGKDLENCWDLIVKADCDEVARLAAFKEWDDDTPEIAEVYTDSDVERVKSSQGEVNVMVKTPKKEPPSLQIKIEQELVLSGHPAVMTPPRSPQPLPEHGETTPPTTPTRIKLIVNPASAYPPLSSILPGKQGPPMSKTSLNKKATKKAVGRPKKAQPLQQKGQIDFMMGKVTKAQHVQQPAVKIPTKPLEPRRDSLTNLSAPDTHTHPTIMQPHAKQRYYRYESPADAMIDTPPNFPSRSRTSTPDEKPSPLAVHDKHLLKILN
jgi:NAD+-dependent protein deacetylase SIR2